MLKEEAPVEGLQDECLCVGVRLIVISLQSTKNTDEDATVEHRLRIHSCDHSVYLLECETLKFLQDLWCSLDLLTFERHERELILQMFSSIRLLM